MSINKDKLKIRQKIVDLRKKIEEKKRADWSNKICEKVLASDEIKNAINTKGVVCVYLASRFEISLKKVIDEILEGGGIIAVPFWEGEEKTYKLSMLKKETKLQKGPMGIEEPVEEERDVVGPEEVDVWLVPGLAFDEDGNRLGYGGGWYDRFLSKAKVGAARIGVCFNFQKIEKLPTEKHDLKMTKIITN